MVRYSSAPQKTNTPWKFLRKKRLQSGNPQDHSETGGKMEKNLCRLLRIRKKGVTFPESTEKRRIENESGNRTENSMREKLIDVLNSGRILPGGTSCVPGQLLTFFRLQDGMPPKENGVATILAEEETLRILGVFRDSDIGNRARNDNEKTWETGDVMECFIQLPGHEDYFEFHVTPEERKLQLHLPSALRRAEQTFEEELCETGLRVAACAEPDRNFWSGELKIPFAGIGLKTEQLNGLAFAICRYNYNTGCPKPEISSTVAFSGETFHAPDQWHILRV